MECYIIVQGTRDDYQGNHKSCKEDIVSTPIHPTKPEEDKGSLTEL